MTGNKRNTKGTKPTKAVDPWADDRMFRAPADSGEADSLRLLALLRERRAFDYLSAMPLGKIVATLGGKLDHWFNVSRSLHTSHWLACIRRDSDGVPTTMFLGLHQRAVLEWLEEEEAFAFMLVSDLNECRQHIDDLQEEMPLRDDCASPAKRKRITAA